MAGERISFSLLRGSALSFGLLEVVHGFCQKRGSLSIFYAFVLKAAHIATNT